MPRLKKTATEMMDKEVQAALASGEILRDMKPDQVGKCIGTCGETYRRRKRNPGEFTLADFRVLVRVFQIDDARILKMVREEK
jgi:hypothetical protein